MKLVPKKLCFLKRNSTFTDLTPLDEAIIGGRNGYNYKSEICVYIDIVKILLKHGAQCADKQKSFRLGDFGRYSNFDRHLAITLLGEGVIDSNAVNEKGETLLDISVKSDQKNILLLLLEKGADCNIKNAEGQMPIHVAITRLKYNKSDLDIVNLLIDHHTDLNVCNNVNETPLHMAAKVGHFEIVRKLIQKRASFDSRNNQCLTPAQVAIKENQTKIAKFFIESYDPRRVLRSAVVKENAPMVKLLLEIGENPNSTELGNITLLHKAVRMGHLKIVQYLIDHGANVEAQTNGSMETPLHYAVKYSSEEMIEELLKNNIQINSLDRDHCTPLWLAVSNGKKEIVEVLIDAGADVNIQDNRNRKPLEIAFIKYGHGAISKLIMGISSRFVMIRGITYLSHW